MTTVMIVIRISGAWILVFMMRATIPARMTAPLPIRATPVMWMVLVAQVPARVLAEAVVQVPAQAPAALGGNPCTEVSGRGTSPAFFYLRLMPPYQRSSDPLLDFNEPAYGGES